MVRFIVALLALLASTAAMAEPQRQTFKDANGRTLGRSSTDARGNTTYYSMGRNTGRSVTDSNGNTILYDKRSYLRFEHSSSAIAVSSLLTALTGSSPNSCSCARSI